MAEQKDQLIPSSQPWRLHEICIFIVKNVDYKKAIIIIKQVILK